MEQEVMEELLEDITLAATLDSELEDEVNVEDLVQNDADAEEVAEWDALFTEGEPLQALNSLVP